ncbi:hypothetical protein VC83_06074 [Pseudogymnoascus destructans]|uniref:Uncharacterized protein n=1 Tax=Pseudogymnoascus destructans TaxID=655981 RepID=A0A177A9Z5_9PEZI|nr:uncharacterized protein VC83_06074 [Pseudogymnoascus destructans]OAF58947.1 hypothetical protein VC83_06074 [Pseudogymnoascus destructans]
MTCELTEVALGHRLVLMYEQIDLDSRDKVNIPVSLENKMDLLESVFLFWKNSYAELITSSAKFLACTLDNMYDGHSLSHTVLEGDDNQRVNVLSELCSKHGFSLCLAKLALRVIRESHEGPAEEFLELQDLVKLDGTIVLDMVPWSASQVVQTNLSDVFNTENTSSYISNGEGCATSGVSPICCGPHASGILR